MAGIGLGLDSFTITGALTPQMVAAMLAAGLWKYQPPDLTALNQIVGMEEGDRAIVLDDMTVWEYDGSQWVNLGASGVITTTQFDPAMANQSHLAALLGQVSREAGRLRAAQGETPPLSSAVAALSAIIGQLARQVDGGRIALAGGSLDDPALRIGTASIYSTAADTLSVAVAGAERLRITTSGIMVFGTVTEA